MLTTPALIQFLQLREGFRKQAYDDANPHVTLTEEIEIEGTLTIGYGTTRYPDGTPVAWHDTVSKSEAVDYLQHYIRETIEPALENLIHVPLAGCQYDALGSCIYQYGEGEVASWNLIRLINRGADWEDIANEWLDGTVMWLGEPLFFARRIMELFMFLGLDWRAGENVPTLTNPVIAAERMGFDGTLPKPDPIVDPDLFNELEIPKMKPITDPTPETPITTRDANWMQLESLKTGRPIDYGVPIAPVGNKPLSINTKQAEEVPYGIDPKAGMQPKEEADRVIRYVKKKQGEELERWGKGLTLATGMAATANEFAGETNSFLDTLGTTGLILLGLAFGLGALWWIAGFVRKKYNERKEVEAEINAVQGIY
ncbi:MAG: lysozyme [Pseudomonadota bacterium]